MATNVRRVSPSEARALCEQGYLFVDVRSEPEFAQAHPEGAYNVPLLHAGPGGMAPNPDFLSVMEARFPKDTRLVLGCRSGGRSLKAAEVLLGAGFTDVIDQRAGFDGARDAFGSLTEKGWAAAGLPTATAAQPGRSYAELKAR